jgi:hypothetical protein
MSSITATSSSLLKPATVEQAAAKVGIFGPQGSGKTTTSALLAIGLSKMFHNSAPVAFMDTENGSDYLVPIFEIEQVPLLVIKSRAFTDMKAVLVEAREKGCCVDLVDSYTHPWRELNDSLKTRLKVKELQFRHMDELKGLWQSWTDLMLNSPLHVIVSGRLGYVWDKEEDEETGKKELVKLGTKMKSENEAGYEPSLLIEMEATQDDQTRQRKTRSKRGTITHHAYVLKDRWRTLNGLRFDWPDLNDYKPGGYKKVFEAFLPHFSKLAIGKEQRAVNAARTSSQLFDDRGNSPFQKRQQQVTIALEEFWETLATIWPGQDGQSKELRRIVVETIYGTRSRTAVEAKSLEELEFGLRVLQAFETAAKIDTRLLTEKAETVSVLETLKALPQGDEEDDFRPRGEKTVALEGAQVR